MKRLKVLKLFERVGGRRKSRIKDKNSTAVKNFKREVFNVIREEKTKIKKGKKDQCIRHIMHFDSLEQQSSISGEGRKPV